MPGAIYLPEVLYTIADRLETKGAAVLLVGGAVRDMVMGQDVKDYDIEVYGLTTLDELESVLSKFGSVSQVGKHFGIVKLRIGDVEYDFSFPRTERKTGRGHTGFEVEIDGMLDFKEAAHRRDFTINAIGYNIKTYEILDPFGGLNDIRYKILRHIDDSTFIEDPLRVYRAIQFAARFGFDVAENTAVLCKQMVASGVLEELPKERIYEEWKKLLLKAPKPSMGFGLMREWGITEHCFLELHALIDVPQDTKYHPEGDVWTHTMLSIDAMASILNKEEKVESRSCRVLSPDSTTDKHRNEKRALKLLFAELCHDFGKPMTTTVEEGCIKAIGHEKAGIEPTRSFMYRLTEEHDFIESILPLVEHHLKPSQFYKQGAKASAIRRLATKVNIEDLVLVAKADFLGRTTPEAKKGVYEAGEWLLGKAEELKVKNRPIEPILQGRDLIALGMQPSPRFGTILDEVYGLQLDGVISDREGALDHVKRHHCQ
ncbi:CCA tRNA nucleotidyltransferase [Sulfurovum sp. NBC37-1]|uniref:CCA tRNA nucleotidyltransferase n=1 Tax=Sulfurovum sp. (strain NBC37-1) TaxID=387093 RepID=UPI0001587726|nr:HD domain-containing protein [Sulfurovum sp. NBC37-1]BAF71919.1 polynucleotide adenylyltransferase/metal-dependent phosphohydrolase [Sulfurovum sp. NBC37-1]